MKLKLISYQRSVRLNLEYHTRRYSKTCIETERMHVWQKLSNDWSAWRATSKAIDSKVRAVTAFCNNWSTDQVQQWQLQPGKEILFRSQLGSFCILCERWYKNQKKQIWHYTFVMFKVEIRLQLYVFLAILLQENHWLKWKVKQG